MEQEILYNNPLSRRCPRLGGPVGFKYCMSGEGEHPCAKVVDCWWETFDIVRYLRDNLSEDQFDRLLNARPRPKVASLVELIAQAKERQGVQKGVGKQASNGKKGETR